jgi:EAL domain-containing protein (putative c-di-GMP-specific phosphodiesterase class I)
MMQPDFFLFPLPGESPSSSNSIPEMVHLLRKHLGMDVAFVAEFQQSQREIKVVDTEESDCPVQPGVCTPIEETYCRFVIDGVLPEIMPDVKQLPIAMSLLITKELDIGSYISVPIRLGNGTIYGTLCCYSHEPDSTLGRRDLRMLHACAEMTARQVDQREAATRRQREIEERVQSVLSLDRIAIVYQPIFDVSKHVIVGFESLSRFDVSPEKSPDTVFNEAHEFGLGTALEMKAIRLALQALPCFKSDLYIAVNASPQTIANAGFAQLFDSLPLERVTLEVTEHAAVDRYPEVLAALAPLRQQGLQLAIDDAGAGYASFKHILQLSPDRIKLDHSLIRDIHADLPRRALIAAFMRFSEEIGAGLVAEGVEKEEELKVLQELGVEKVQGYFLGRPIPLGQATALTSR